MMKATRKVRHPDSMLPAAQALHWPSWPGPKAPRWPRLTEAGCWQPCGNGKTAEHRLLPPSPADCHPLRRHTSRAHFPAGDASHLHFVVTSLVFDLIHIESLFCLLRPPILLLQPDGPPPAEAGLLPRLSHNHQQLPAAIVPFSLKKLTITTSSSA